MTRIVWLPEAADELEQSQRWYAERSAAAAEAFADRIVDALGEIQQAPGRWQVADHGTRRFPLRRFPFAVVYRWRPADDVVEVVAIAHGRREPGYWGDRS